MKFRLALILILALTGCSFYDTAPVLQRVSATVALKIPVIGRSILWMTKEESTLYVPEYSKKQLSSIELSTLKVNWISSLPYEPASNPVVLNNNIFVFARHSAKLMWLDTSGTLKGVITLVGFDTDVPLTRSFRAAKSDTALLWEGWNTPNNSALWRLDPAKDLSPDPLSPGNYLATPKALWKGTKDHGIIPYAAEGQVYWGYITFDITKDDPLDDYFLSINELSGQVNWEVSGTGVDFKSDMEPILYKGDLLSTCMSGIFSIRLSDGTITRNYKDAAWSQGLAIVGNIAYTPFSNPPENVIALDLDTGKRVWSQTYEATAGTPLAVHNGIVYQATQGDLRLYRQSDGAYLGIDKTLSGDAAQGATNFVYNNFFIFISSSYLTIINMDFLLDSQGKLTR